MSAVWAFRSGAWTADTATGWSHTIEMRSLFDLTVSLDVAKLKGLVSHLGIVAQGDQPGQVMLNSTLAASSLAGFEHELKRLRGYMTPAGMLTFYACIAGKGDEGSVLLTRLSRELPGRTIVGFELCGLIGTPSAPHSPGQVIASEALDGQLAVSENAPHEKLTPWCSFAKRARDGKIVHYPLLEQNARPNKRCANPGCLGHSDAHRYCQGW